MPPYRKPVAPRRHTGQALVEYLWVIAIIAIVSIPAFTFTRQAQVTFFNAQQRSLSSPAFPTATPVPTATPTVSPYIVPTDEGQCKNGGWQYFVTPAGTFKNQGDCESWVKTNGKNAPANP